MKKYLCTALLLLIALAAMAGSPLQQAWDHAWKGDFKKAVKEYRAFAIAHPDDPQAAVALYDAANLSLTQVGDSGAAGKLFIQVADKYPGTRWAAESCRQLSLISLEQKRPQEAADYFRRALISAGTSEVPMPETWIAGLAQGWNDHAADLNDPELAAQVYAEVLAVLPKGETAAQTQADLAAMLKKSGKEAEAAALLAELMTGYPHTRIAGKALKEERDLVSRYRPEFPWEEVQAMSAAGSMMRAGNYAAADSIYSTVQANYPSTSLGENAGFGKIGAAVYLSGDFQTALNELRDYAAKYPKGYRHKDVQRRLDAWGDLARMEASLKEDPRDYSTHCSVGTTQFWMRFYAQAEGHFRQATEIDSTIGYAWFWLGEVCNTRGEFPSALEAYRKYLTVEPSGTYATPAQAAVDSLKTKN